MKKIIICILVVTLTCVTLTSCLKKFQNKEEKEGVKENTVESIENEENNEEKEQEETLVHIHDFSLKNVDDKYLKSQASCTEGVQYYYSCSCGEKGAEAFSIGNALGHKFGEWKVYKEATYTEEGIKRKICFDCGAYEDTKIDKLVKPKEETPSKPVVKEEPKVETPVVKEEPKVEKPTATSTSKEINVPKIEQKELTVDKITQTTKSIDPAEFVIYKGSITKEDQVDTYEFTAPRQGIYNFEFSGMKSGFKTDFYLYDELGEVVKQTYYGGVGNDVNVYYISEPNKTYTIKVKQYSLTGDYTLKIGIKKPTVDVSGVTVVKDSIEYLNQTNNYTFTAPRQGIYNFNFSGIKSGFKADFYILNDLGETIKQTYYGGVENSTDVSAILSEGQTYTLKVEQYSGTGDYTINIGLKKPTVDISAYTTIKDSIEYFDQTNNYTFTVPCDGRYRFEFSGMKSGIQADVFVMNKLDEIIAETYYGVGNGEGITIKDLKKGEVYTVKVEYYSGTGDYTLNIGHQKPTVDINSTSIINDSIEFTDQRNVYNFTATKAGTHTFTVTGMGSGNRVEIMAFNELEETVAKNTSCSNDGKITLKDLKVGEKYEIQVRYSNSETDYKLTVK